MIGIEYIQYNNYEEKNAKGKTELVQPTVRETKG